MLHNNQKIEDKYKEIQKKLFYMIPEKWDEVYLYASVIEEKGTRKTGELFFYYTPKGIIKRKPINVYEVPSRFNIDEEEYLRLVEMLYNTIKELKQEFKDSRQKLWSNLTITIKNYKFKVEYNYKDLLRDNEYTNYERHIIWRYKYLNQGIEYCNREERKVLERYINRFRVLNTNQTYEEGLYITNIRNIVDYETAGYESIQSAEYVSSKDEKERTNQILFKK
ncbi:MAG: DUF600 family protein [Clostridia bacterium]|nr:DUF600 family protein [Clostridia bacterium]